MIYFSEWKYESESMKIDLFFFKRINVMQATYGGEKVHQFRRYFNHILLLPTYFLRTWTESKC